MGPFAACIRQGKGKTSQALFFLPGGLLIKAKAASRSPPSGCSAPALPRRTSGDLLLSTALMCAPAGGPSEGPGVPSQLETLLPGHRKGHPSRLGHAVGPSTVKLLMPLASNGGRDHHVAVRTSSWTHWSLGLFVGHAGPVVGLLSPLKLELRASCLGSLGGRLCTPSRHLVSFDSLKGM